jgi:3-deoxy-D-manno-octulosonic-acid transferase
MTRLAYTLLSYLLLPYALVHLAWRSRREPAYLEHLGERFGRYALKPGRPLIWLHAVSLGETRGAEPLVKALLTTYPEHVLLLTHMTPTGREAGRALYGDRVLQSYLPYDYPTAVARFLAHFSPRIGIVMETEIWPNLVRACRVNNIPLFLVNARMSVRSAQGYARFPGFTRETLNELAAIAAQTAADAARLEGLGACKVSVTGNLKFDIEPPAQQLALGEAFRAAYGIRPVLLAASTREGEENLFLDAVAKMAVPGLLAVIVPRHPQRFDEVARLVAARGLSLQRRSEKRAISGETQVVLGDSLGEMFAYYCAADVAFVGGSLVEWGGHNLIEACAVGTPVLVGPHTMNFPEATDGAIAEGAAIRVADPGALAEAAAGLLNDPARRERMSAAGRAFASRHRGSTTRLLALISRAMC